MFLRKARVYEDWLDQQGEQDYGRVGFWEVPDIGQKLDEDLFFVNSA